MKKAIHLKILVAWKNMAHKYSSCCERIVAYLNKGKREEETNIVAINIYEKSISLNNNHSHTTSITMQLQPCFEMELFKDNMLLNSWDPMRNWALSYNSTQKHTFQSIYAYLRLPCREHTNQRWLPHIWSSNKTKCWCF